MESVGKGPVFVSTEFQKGESKIGFTSILKNNGRKSSKCEKTTETNRLLSLMNTKHRTTTTKIPQGDA